MDDLLHKLAAHRRRIKVARVADAALRWGFYASVAACLAVLVSKFAGVALPTAVAAAALAALPVAMALREGIRSFSIRDCAIHLDRHLGLDERLSTALETVDGMGPLLRADARGALERSPLPRHAFPRESKLLAGSALLLAALLAIPSPDRSGAAGDPAFQEVTATELQRLESLANVDVQFKEAAEALPDHPEQALAILEEKRAELMAKLLESGGDASAAETRKLLEQVTASSAAISAELRRLGRTVHAPPPAVAKAKLQRQKAVEQEAVLASAAVASSGASRVASAASVPWNPRYEPIIRRYFGREP